MSNEIIKRFEGFRSKPYLDEAGIPTIGYGTIRYPAGPLVGKKVTMSDFPVTEKAASYFLEQYIIKEIKPVMNKYIKVPININQRRALESLIYNIGASAFSRSTVLKKLNADDFEGSADAFLMWEKVRVNGRKKVSKGLRKRRQEERALFLDPSYKTVVPVPEIPMPKEESLWTKLNTLIKGLFKKGN